MDTQLETSTGTLVGRVADGVVGFRGVPYARPPVGRARFAAPVAAEPWRGVRDARHFGAVAPQRGGELTRMLGFDAPQAEDCLTLNVWTPAVDAARRPVLVWIHGGSFVSGAGSMPVYDGARLARRGDVVVVTLNYRLGVLGFLTLPEERSGAANRGLLDQIEALRFVRANAEAFGGDPDQITVFGESAGAMSIVALLGMPEARGLFARAALQSGAAPSLDPDEAAFVARSVRAAYGGGVRLEEAPPEALLDAQQQAQAVAWRELGKLAFQPVVDGTHLPEAPLASLRGGAAVRVPLLLGTNLEEQRLWALGDRRLATLDDPGLLRRLERALGGSSHAREALALYRGLAPEATPAELWLAIETDRAFRIPTLRVAEAQHAQGSDVFLYRFGWRSPALGGSLGACHALEIPFVFGNLEGPGLDTIVGGGGEVPALSAAMQDAWIAFARRGNPATADAPWPVYEPGRRATRRFDAEGGVVDAPGEAERRWFASLEPAA